MRVLIYLSKNHLVNRMCIIHRELPFRFNLETTIAKITRPDCEDRSWVGCVRLTTNARHGQSLDMLSVSLCSMASSSRTEPSLTTIRWPTA